MVLIVFNRNNPIFFLFVSYLWQRNVGKETEKLNLLSIQNHNIMTQPAITQTGISNVQIWSYESTKEKVGFVLEALMLLA